MALGSCSQESALTAKRIWESIAQVWGKEWAKEWGKRWGKEAGHDKKAEEMAEPRDDGDGNRHGCVDVSLLLE